MNQIKAKEYHVRVTCKKFFTIEDVVTRPYLIAANWKMHKTRAEAQSFSAALTSLVPDTPHQVYIAPPYTSIQDLAVSLNGSSVKVGAQNMNDAKEGAFTGEIAGEMLLDVGAKFVILGHSERRHLFGESNAFINGKVLRALDIDLQPIVCVGETLEQREAGATEAVLKKQLKESLEGLKSAEICRCVIAYEPVWAIGTGKTATPEMAQEAHAFIREFLLKQWGKRAHERVQILYGGSVKPDNAAAIMGQPDIDGVLVGGASLDPASFAGIVNFQIKRG